ncbi:divergent polysaccharide deacetylase family protein [Ruegeria sp. R13_0]|uniref:divergent polysaccharide deacetylase family protein n=1 Tax=Ruegeria sp. R13_0 TaxID=2821099 RepID=UPI001ADD505C|nr:divergent polysaccharide deacetylase family protein [Ruegeria sp. R13_0]MBO9435162.1 divergent polysaccharide deacetylase family protein [Ruegeria sp. R13_0]
MRGFFGGMIVGAVVVLIVGVMLSLNTPLANKPVVKTQAPEPVDVETPEAPEQIAETPSDADLVELPPAGPKPAEAPDEALDLSDLETVPDEQPSVAEAGDALQEPQAEDQTSVTVMTDAPAAPQAPSTAPASPETDAAPVVVDEAPEPSAEPEDVATLLPELPSQLAPEEAELDEENPFENSPIAVEGDEDTLPRNLPKLAALPQIGGEDTTSTNTLVGTRVVPLTERDDTPVETDEAVVDEMTGKPIEDYAASFENPEAKPLMSIILIDDEGSFGAEALQDFPYPVSFAISPSDPDAAEKMARHRAAGFEVLAMADLHESASAQDAEVSMAVWLDTLHETVGILEGVESGIQGNRKLADQVASIAAATGRGLITQDNGLNTVQKLAARNGIPSGVVFRDIDGARQDPKIMRRFLDQAAFRAGQEGTVVMLGRVRPETISALLLWGLEDRGNRVAMAPISAVMKREVQ